MYRRHLKHSRVKNLFKFASIKMNTVFTVESSLEFDTCFHLEFSPLVDTFEAQPEGFYYYFEGHKLPYTPDFRVTDCKNTRYFLEVKPAELVVEPDFLQRFPAKQQAAFELDCPLKLVTEKQIRMSPTLGNLKLLYRYSGFQTITPLHMQLLELLAKTGKVSLSHLCYLTGASKGEVSASTLYLIARGWVKSNLTEQAFGMTTSVWVNSVEE